VASWIYLKLENSITETNTSSAVSTIGFRRGRTGTNGAIGSCFQYYKLQLLL
jgi:hypothetical protein